MGLIKTLLAALSGLKIMSWLRVIPLPGLGWLGGAASAVWGAVVAVIGAIVQGFVVILANPITLATVGFIALLTFSAGLEIGSREGRKRVRTAEIERTVAHEQAQKRAAEAAEARRIAEEAEEKLAALETQPKPAAAPKPRSVRKPDAKPDRDRPGVPSLQTIWDEYLAP